MKLGEKVKFQKSLTYSKWYKDWDKEETIKFASENKISILEGKEYTNGIRVKSKWKVKKHKDIQEGIICGVRTLDLNGIYNYEDGYCRGDSKKVYLVAVNLSGFLRVPEEFILTD